MIFFSAVWVHCHHRDYLRWELVVLLILASLPFLLPLLAFYVKEIGKDGVLFNSIFEGTFDPTVVSLTANEPTPTGDGNETKVTPLSSHSKAARKVLRTLWKFQREHFKGELTPRWLFGIHPLSTDYPQFNSGAHELRWEKLIINDPRGMVGLSDLGVKYCQDNQKDLDASDDVWANFSPA